MEQSESSGSWATEICVEIPRKIAAKPLSFWKCCSENAGAYIKSRFGVDYMLIVDSVVLQEAQHAKRFRR